MSIRLAALISLSAAISATPAQEPDSARCYRFNGPFFSRLSWTAERRAWAVDTSSVAILTQVPHPRGAIARASDERTVLAPFPPADSVRWRASAVTSWNAPAADRLVLNWFYGPSNFAFTLAVRGDTLRGQVQDHADRIDPGVRIYNVLAVRVQCPVIPPSNEQLELAAPQVVWFIREDSAAAQLRRARSRTALTSTDR